MGFGTVRKKTGEKNYLLSFSGAVEDLHLLLRYSAFASLHSVWKSSPLHAHFPFLGAHFDEDLDPFRPRAGKISLLCLGTSPRWIPVDLFLRKAVPTWSCQHRWWGLTQVTFSSALKPSPLSCCLWAFSSQHLQLETSWLCFPNAFSTSRWPWVSEFQRAAEIITFNTS